MGLCSKGQHSGRVAYSCQPGLLPSQLASGSAPHQWEKLWQWLGPCLLRKIERLKKIVCVLLQIMCFLWSTLVIPEFFHPWSTCTFHKHSWRGALETIRSILEAECIPGVLKRILVCKIALWQTLTDLSQRLLWLILRSLGICKQGSKQDIFLPCTQ